MRVLPHNRLLRLAVLAPLLVATFWCAGFAWFLLVTARLGEPPPQADGIVALTGGSERVETGLRLLAEDRARLLLISGVGHAADFRELAHRAGVDAALARRVTLGRIAVSTRGNAAETAEWVRANNLHSLIVVTSGYHMPRALIELGRSLPGIALHPVPVVPASLRGGHQFSALRLLAGEYTKLLVTEAGLSSLASRGDEHPPSLQPDKSRG